ncbi:MAG TPA: DUF2147 domain-containing protein [Rhodanobacteraceae bacterium]
MRTLLAASLIAFASLPGTSAIAADETPAPVAHDTPVGTWTQVDDETGRPKSIIEISTAPDGTLQGVVKQVLFSEQGPHPVCDKCEGERHNQPVEGMTIMWGVKKDGDQWDGGQILDPHNGKTYKVRLRLTDNGEKLDVHGYIGFALLGRSQVWTRKTD